MLVGTMQVCQCASAPAPVYSARQGASQRLLHMQPPAISIVEIPGVRSGDVTCQWLHLRLKHKRFYQASSQPKIKAFLNGTAEPRRSPDMPNFAGFRLAIRRQSGPLFSHDYIVQTHGSSRTRSHRPCGSASSCNGPMAVSCVHPLSIAVNIHEQVDASCPFRKHVSNASGGSRTHPRLEWHELIASSKG